MTHPTEAPMGNAIDDGKLLDRDALGRRVREAWVKWALTQPNPKPSWLVPYDDLAECDKEADRQIGEAIASLAPAIDDGKGVTHRHVKRGSEYALIGIGKMQADSWLEFRPSLANAPLAQVSVNMREVAIYRSATDPTEIWVRPREEFEDGRFEVLPLSPAPSQHTGWSDKAVEAFDRALEAAPSMDPYDGRRQLLIAGVKLRAALSAASSISPATGFEVNKLTWELDDENWWVAQPPAMIGGFGYEVRVTDGSKKVRTRRGHEDWAYFDGTADEAKTHWQADFDRRIRSSISPSVSKESGEP